MIIRGQFSDLFMGTMLPAINSVVFERFNLYPPFYTRFLNVLTSDRSIEQFTQVSGVGLFQLIPEGEAVRYDSPVQGFDTTFTHKRYGLAMKVSQDVVEDDKFGIVTQRSKALSRSMRETIELQAISVINNGFGTNGYDGVPLFSASHPLVKIGGTQSNLLTTAADLDPTSVELAFAQYETQKDSSGKLIRVPVKSLMVHPSNRVNAFEIFKSAGRSDTANRVDNALKYQLDGIPDIVVNPYISDSDSWYLFAPPAETGLVWFWRRKPYTKGWVDDPTEAGHVAMRYKCSYGYYDYMGTFATPGA